MEEIKSELEALQKEYCLKEQNLLDKLTPEERKEIGHPIKSIFMLDRFKANGVQYVIRTSLTIERFEQFEKVQIRVGYGVDFREMFANLRKSYDYLNGSQPADAAIVLYNIMNGVKNELSGRENEVLELCCLFICTEDEDVTTFDQELNRKKIEDWKREGIDMESFFTLAFSLVNGFIPIYEQISGSISEHLEKTKNALKS